ncbi:hypothetical protein THAOC_05405 [Thalassiosira oceanica]|uniref:Uncharacterized protein n=1 Tax=Thalassiosira oceanica TaxID=159749 RepID=K0TMU9_THAOC|nr:hypothetical protein THAOC_05405 [Thalassiosira oceanica]|eukprot:EJK73002.1 hypothetical protein THAOC_05405 [Thalassiosira oceanica]
MISSTSRTVGLLAEAIHRPSEGAMTITTPRTQNALSERLERIRRDDPSRPRGDTDTAWLEPTQDVGRGHWHASFREWSDNTILGTGYLLGIWTCRSASPKGHDSSSCSPNHRYPPRTPAHPVEITSIETPGSASHEGVRAPKEKRVGVGLTYARIGSTPFAVRRHVASGPH